MRFSVCRLAGAAILAAVAGLSGTASATVLVDRGLPADNLNNAAGADRSNVSWDFGGYGWFYGDSFSVSNASGWIVTDVTTYMTLGGVGGSDNDADFGDDPGVLGDVYSSLSLFMGPAGGSISAVSSGNFIGGTDTTDNANISFQRVQYADVAELDYQGSGGSYIAIWEVTFHDLALFVPGGTEVWFGVDGIGVGDDIGDPHPDAWADDQFSYWFNHASNDALDGVTSDGADNLMRCFFSADGVVAEDCGAFTSQGYGWDKASDINVLVQGQAVPEPGSLALIGLGLAGMGVLRRRRRAA